jgi:photosystem II stability/assembly factor-like uncharacterized protein
MVMRRMLRYGFRLFPAILAVLILAAGCARPAPTPGGGNAPPTAGVDPAITDGATGAVLWNLNGSLGWAAVNFDTGQTPHSLIIDTADGGATWRQLNAPGPALTSSLMFVDPLHGWALTRTNAAGNFTHAAIMATGDGGKTWAQQWAQDLPNWGAPYRMQFLDARDGFVLVDVPRTSGTQYALLATTDGGATWAQRGSGLTLDSFSFSDRLTGWATGANSIWHTTDGGVTWAKQWTVPDKIRDEFAYSTGIISSASPTSCWALFQGNAAMQQTTKLILHTNDGGSTWSITGAYLPGIPPGILPGGIPGARKNTPAGTAPHYTTVRFAPVSATAALVAASPPTEYPVLYRSEDSGATWSTLSDGMSAAPGLPKGAWGDLSFINDRDGWAAVIKQAPSPDGKTSKRSLSILKTGDGGKTWTTLF